MAEDLQIKDPRIEFFAVYVLKTMKLKADKWIKMFNVEDYEKMITEYVEKKENDLLYFQYTGQLSQSQSGQTGTLLPTHDLPRNIQKKTLYFIKINRGTMIPIDTNMKAAFLYGDISYSPMAQLSAIVDEVNL